MEMELSFSAIWTFFDTLSEGVMIIEQDGSMLYANQSAIQFFGLQDNDQAITKIEQSLQDRTLWASLIASPEEQMLHEVNGRYLYFTAQKQKFAGKQVVQLLVNPYESVVTKSVAQKAIDFTDQLTALTRINSEPIFDKKLQLIVDGLQQIGWNRVGLTLRDSEFNPTQLITAGFSQEEKKFLLDNLLPAEIWLSLFKEKKFQQTQFSSCVFVPGNSKWSKEHLGYILPDTTALGQDEGAWHEKDLLCAVLYDRQRRKIGLIGLDQPQNGRRPSPHMMQTIELYAQFAASIIENSLLIDESINRSREFEILFNASHALADTLDQNEILSILGDHMLQAVNADGYTIFRWQERENKLTVLRDYGHSASATQQMARGTAVKPNNPDLINQILHTQKPQVYERINGNLPLPPPDWITNSDDQCTCVLLPLILSEGTYGLVHIIKQGKQAHIGEQEKQLLAALINQATSALETALIFEDTYEREQFYNALGYVNMAINSTLDSQTVLNLICSEGVRIFDVDSAYIWQLEKSHFVGTAAKGANASTFINSRVSLTDTSTLVSQLAEKGEVTYLNNVPTHSEIQIKLPQPAGIQSILGVPLEQDGKLIGLLILVDTQNPNHFSSKDISWSALFGIQAAIALQNATLFAELRRFNEELDLRVAERTQALNEESNRVKVLLRINTELSASLDQDRVLNRALSLVNKVVNAMQGVILLINPESDELIFRAALGKQAKHISPKGEPSGLKQNEGLAGWMIDNRSAVIVNDTNKDPRWVDLPTSKGNRSVLGVPLITNEEVIGVMMLFHIETNAFTMQQLDLVEAAAIQVANAINNASLYRLISDQADQLGTMLRSEIIQKANLKAILESIADGVIVSNSNNVIELVNMPASTILDMSRNQLIGSPINTLLGLYGAIDKSWIDTIAYWADNADYIEQGTFLTDQLTIEEKVLSIYLSPVLSEKHFYGTVSIFRDITKEVEVDRLKSEFVSTVSHELRTPMTSIKGYADLMLMGAAGSLADSQLRYLQVIKNNADRLHMLVNDLLNISRIETGKTTLDLRPLDIPQMINQIIDGHLNGRIQHTGKQLAVKIDLSPSLPLVNADHARITQVLTNLIDNAFNYTSEDGEICLTAESNGNHVYISVSDTGIGIADEALPKIFDRFYRAEDASVQLVPGTGLGLSIVQSLVEMHGGQLIVESQPGEGSTFTFNLPVVVEDGDPASVIR